MNAADAADVADAEAGRLVQGVQVVILPSAAEAEQHVATLFAEQLRRKPDSVLGLATGGTPVGVYRALVAAHRLGEADFGRARTFNLDEYAGVPSAHPQSYAAYMRTHLFDLVNLTPDRTHLPEGDAANAEDACRLYDALYRYYGPADLQLLGIGLNGHIGFNEPGFASAPGGTHVVRLDESTRRANARFFGADEQVPEYALTMSAGRILQARSIVLLATGAAKAAIVARALEGPIGTDCPASLLQLHPDATVVLDREAAGALAPERG
ncbi:glucosamine-6-phosphate deaminase [Cohnella sp. F6_2S_P_1]|uniref:Glucosamine-6-phosphate deaminase n=1 Tax=Cohnella hashimotonis TaxID=2826895 RepID=A0ABT6T9F6_9BACL|nr:glucosamine-6-phosphate deaminase [Cohnella hashimotonis]